ncbi:polysaccharide pyruvyl transferase family protein [Thioalkalivibrio sp. ALE17]|uniref:polysaccharide pyruvyl transferase family protein n=1 Tax=Thioalkalivibrio sp. ALE17 TaxID=1158173 RepID=UPI000424C584|nr:polysaccharide pyruvyl transferase family protein [Thioalkalivibrio sp. ALE17]
MYLYRYRKRPNFGDELNDYLWPRFIRAPLEPEPGSEDVLVGIGTLLNERLPEQGTLHILGTGYGYGAPPTPDAMRRAKIHFVRGPLTAKTLGVDPSLAISDPGILLNRTEDLNQKKDIDCAFMPHHGLCHDRMKALCEDAGVHFIHPEAPCENVIDQIGRSHKLICSAMHGAIAAEALRVPWLPVITSPEIVPDKWKDWASSLGIEVSFRKLPTIWPTPDPTLRGYAAAKIKSTMFTRTLNRMARTFTFQLGPDNVLENRLLKTEEKIRIFNYMQKNDLAGVQKQK